MNIKVSLFLNHIQNKTTLQIANLIFRFKAIQILFSDPFSGEMWNLIDSHIKLNGETPSLSTVVLFKQAYKVSFDPVRESIIENVELVLDIATAPEWFDQLKSNFSSEIVTFSFETYKTVLKNFNELVTFSNHYAVVVSLEMVRLLTIYSVVHFYLQVLARKGKVRKSVL